MAAFDFALARDNMIENDVRTNDVTDTALIDAMRAVPRELFVPAARRYLAYTGMPVPLGGERTLSDARTFAKLAQALKVTAGARVLVIASATGYSAAVLALMGATAIGLESDAAMADTAEANWKALGLAVLSRRGPLEEGAPKDGPFDVILIDGAVEELPAALAEQLKDGGRLGLVLQEGVLGRAQVLTCVDGIVTARTVFNATLPLLPGFSRPKTFVF